MMKIARGRGVLVPVLALAGMTSAGMTGGAGSALAASPSFDCMASAGANQPPIEALLCNDGGLARLDGMVGEALAKLKGTAGYDKALADQRAWIRRRDSQCPAPKGDQGWAATWAATRCLAPLYADRLRALGATPPAPPPSASTRDYIHPSCIEIASESPVAVSLKACNAGFAHNPPDERQGWLWADGTMEGSLSRSFGYHVAGTLSDGGEVIQTVASGGGSGSFSGVSLVRRLPQPDGDVRLAVSPVPGGVGGDLPGETDHDRCDGAIDQLVVQDGGLLVSYQVTPVLMLRAAGARTATAAARAGLPSCRTCCVGTVSYRHPLDGKANGLAFASFNQAEQVFAPATGARNRASQCFLSSLGKITPTSADHYDRAALTAFAKAFDGCLR